MAGFHRYVVNSGPSATSNEADAIPAKNKGNANEPKHPSRRTDTQAQFSFYHFTFSLAAPVSIAAINVSLAMVRISFIRRARYLGFTLEAVRELLTLTDDNDQSCEAVDLIATAHLAEVERKIADLSALQSELTRVLGSSRQGTIAD